jgi:hypothetical protein
MPFIAAGADYTTQVEPLIKKCPGLARRALIGFVFSNQDFNLFGE